MNPQHSVALDLRIQRSDARLQQIAKSNQTGESPRLITFDNG